jgi:hypothetical protein
MRGNEPPSACSGGSAALAATASGRLASGVSAEEVLERLDHLIVRLDYLARRQCPLTIRMVDLHRFALFLPFSVNHSVSIWFALRAKTDRVDL